MSFAACAGHPLLLCILPSHRQQQPGQDNLTSSRTQQPTLFTSQYVSFSIPTGAGGHVTAGERAINLYLDFSCEVLCRLTCCSHGPTNQYVVRCDKCKRHIAQVAMVILAFSLSVAQPFVVFQIYFDRDLPGSSMNPINAVCCL